MSDEAKLISSRLTPLFKFVLAPMWTLGVGATVVKMWTLPAHGGPDFAMIAIAWIIGTGVMLRYIVPLKTMRMDANGLLISNYNEEMRIPFSDIRSVEQNRWLKTRLITLQLRSGSSLGSTIIFMPKSRTNQFDWSEDPIVPQLRSLASIGPTAGRNTLLKDGQND